MHTGRLNDYYMLRTWTDAQYMKLDAQLHAIPYLTYIKSITEHKLMNKDQNQE